MRASVAVSVDKGRGATPSSRKEEFHGAGTDERHGLRRRLRADQRGAQRGDRVPPGGRWLARSHRQRGDGQYLLVTNAASGDLSVFSVAADGSIEFRERVHTGSTPRSVDESDGLVVVLNTGEPGLASFRMHDEGIAAVEGSDQALDTSDADPAQVAFSPDGSMVVITQRGTDSVVTY